MDDAPSTLNAALVKINRLEKTVAELLLKNEQLRQQTSSGLSSPGQQSVSLFGNERDGFYL